MGSRPAGFFSQVQSDDLFVQQDIFFPYDPVGMVVSKKVVFEPAPLGHLLQKICQGIGLVKPAAQFVLH